MTRSPQVLRSLVLAGMVATSGIAFASQQAASTVAQGAVGRAPEGPGCVAITQHDARPHRRPGPCLAATPPEPAPTFGQSSAVPTVPSPTGQDLSLAIVEAGSDRRPHAGDAPAPTKRPVPADTEADTDAHPKGDAQRHRRQRPSPSHQSRRRRRRPHARRRRFRPPDRLRALRPSHRARPTPRISTTAAASCTRIPITPRASRHRRR